MPKETHGYLTEDGQFFKDEKDAVYYETRLNLLKIMEKSIDLHNISSTTFDDILDFLQANRYSVDAYVTACLAYDLGEDGNGKDDKQKSPKNENEKGSS